jgi:hypothetical protein
MVATQYRELVPRPNPRAATAQAEAIEARLRALERLHGAPTMTIALVGIIATVGVARRRA